MENRQKSQARTWIGIVLILFGTLLFLKKTDIINFELPFEIFSWGGFVFLVGTIILLTSKNKILGALIMFLGMIFTYPELWPLPMIVLGFYLIFNRKGLVPDHEKIYKVYLNFSENNPNKIEDVAVFGGGHKSYLIDNFLGGRILAIFGGSEIDLRGCRLSENGASVEVVGIFGGTSIQAPPDWNIVIDVVPIFGGFSDSRHKSPAIEVNKDKTIVFKGLVIFGGGEIK